jgi:hypothetical protein
MITGNRPRERMLAQQKRLAGFDGRLSDLGKDLPPNFMPLVSDNWQQHFEWTGTGSFTEAERAKLNGLVQKTHAEHRRLRFWATPDSQQMWDILQAAGVDLINTDRLEELNRFLAKKG